MSTSYGRIPRAHSSTRHHNCNICASHAQATFRKNLKELVRDHLHNCIVLSSAEPDTPRFIPTASPSSREDDGSILRRGAEFYGTAASESNSDGRIIRFSAAARSRRSRLLDRWAAQQAREIFTTIERQAHEAEIAALANAQPVSALGSSFLRESSPARSESSVDVPNNLQTSSLVQMWREFEATRVNQTGSVHSAISSRTNLFSNAGSEISADDERYDALLAPDESMTSWESDQTAPSERLSFTQVSDAGGDSERGQVADMIRRLTSGNRTQSSVTSWSDEIEREQAIVREPSAPQEQSSSLYDHRLGDRVGFRALGRNPVRVRRPQVIRDLLGRIEKERRRELARLVDRRAVSRFSHRGRIQALLRFRFLRRSVTGQDQQHPASTTATVDRPHNGASMLLLRERFNRRGEHDSNAVPITDSSNNFSLQYQNNSLDSEHSDLADQIVSETQQNEEITARDEECTQSTLVSMASTSEELQEEASRSPDLAWQDTSLVISNLDWQGTTSVAVSLPGWEGDVVMEEAVHDSRQTSGGTWLSDYSNQGRSWGSSHRQATYQAWLEKNSDNKEILELLERRSVTKTLTSDFREKMDRMVLSFLQRQADEPISDGNIAEEGQRGPVLLQDHEARATDIMASTSSQLPPPSCLYHQQGSWKHSSFARRSSPDSLEMELICDLKGDMVRLHQEMSELRKSIESCVHMQVEIQRTMKQEVSPPICHSGSSSREALQSSKTSGLKKGSCCICYEMQVDSLLYKCGHMCTCFKCAHELQWSSGKCPICRAQIVDVVRAYPDP